MTIADDIEYIDALAAARAHPTPDTLMRVHRSFAAHHATSPAECDRLWREALHLVHRFGEDTPTHGNRRH